MCLPKREERIKLGPRIEVSFPSGWNTTQEITKHVCLPLLIRLTEAIGLVVLSEASSSTLKAEEARRTGSKKLRRKELCRTRLKKRRGKRPCRTRLMKIRKKRPCRPTSKKLRKNKFPRTISRKPKRKGTGDSKGGHHEDHEGKKLCKKTRRKVNVRPPLVLKVGDTITSLYLSLTTTSLYSSLRLLLSTAEEMQITKHLD